MKRSFRFYIPAFLALLLTVSVGLLYWAQVSEKEASIDRRTFDLLELEGVHLSQSLKAVDSAIEAARQQCASRDDCQLPNYLRSRVPGIEVAILSPTENRNLNGFRPNAAVWTATSARSAIKHTVLGREYQFAGLTKDVQIDLASLFQSTLSPITTGYLRSIALCDDRGSVLWQIGKEPLRIESLMPLLVPRPNAPGANASQPVPAVSGNESASPFAATNKLPAKLRGADYYVYLHPTDLQIPVHFGTSEPSNPRDGDSRIFVVGLLGRGDYQSFAQELPVTYLAGASALFLAIAGILWPMLKVRTMSHRERITRWDMRVLTLAFLGASFLLALVYLSWGFAINLERRTRVHLASIAVRIKQNFAAELFSALNVLHSQAFLLQTIHGSSDRLNPESMGSRPISLRDVLSDGRLTRSDIAQYPDFQELIYLRNHKLVTQLTADQTSSWAVNLPAFAENIDGAGALLSIKDRSGSQYDFQIDTTAPGILVLSTNGPTPADVVQIVTQPYSLVDAVMPFGFSFVVFDETGRVRFHSDRPLDDAENFYSQLDDSQPARMLATYRSRGEFETRYRGTRSEFFLEPIDGPSLDVSGSTSPGRYFIHGLGWTVAVFRDQGYLDTLKFDVGRVFTLGLCSLMAPFFLWRISKVIMHRKRGKPFSYLFMTPTWDDIWPRERRRGHYSYVTWVAIGWIGLTASSIGSFVPESHQYAWAVMSSIVCLSVCVLYSRSIVIAISPKLWKSLQGAAEKRLSRESLGLLYSVHITAALIAIVGFVAVLVYTCSLNYSQYRHRYRLVQDGQAQIEARDHRIRNQALASALGTGSKDIQNARRSLQGDNYDIFATSERCTLIDELAHQPQVRWLGYLHDWMRFVPFRDTKSEAFGQLPLEGIPGCDGNEGVHTPFRAFADAEVSATGLWTPLPPPTQSIETIMFYLSGVLLSLATSFGVYKVVARVFLLEMGGPRPLEGLELASSIWEFINNHKRVFLINQPLSRAFKRISAAAPPSRFTCVDLAADLVGNTKNDLARSYQAIRTKLAGPSSLDPVILDNFDFRIDERLVNSHRLQLLEQLVYGEKRRVVILSNIDPIDYFSPLLKRTVNTGADNEDLTRWIRALSSFEYRSCHGPGLDWRINDILRTLIDEFAEPKVGSAESSPRRRNRHRDDCISILTRLVSGKSTTDLAELLRRLRAANPNCYELRLLSDNLKEEARAIYWHCPDQLADCLAKFEKLAAAAKRNEAPPNIPWNTLLRVYYLSQIALHLYPYRGGEEWTKATSEHIEALKNVKIDNRLHLGHRLQEYSCIVEDELRYSHHFLLEGGWMRIVRPVLERLTDGRNWALDTIHVNHFSDALAADTLEAASRFYQRIWSTTREEERLVLYQLAQDRWTNPRNREAISHLVRRGVVEAKFGGSYGLSRSFRWFVEDVQDETEVNVWIAEEKASLWSSLRLGIVTFGALFFFGLLYLGGQGLIGSYLGYITAVGGALLTMFELGKEFLRKPIEFVKSPNIRNHQK